MVFNVHSMLSASLKVEELAITEDESESLTNAVMTVANEYQLVADPKTIAWANLLFVLSATYGTRFFAYNNRMKAERKKPEAGKLIQMEKATQ